MDVEPENLNHIKKHLECLDVKNANKNKNHFTRVSHEIVTNRLEPNLGDDPKISEGPKSPTASEHSWTMNEKSMMSNAKTDNVSVYSHYTI